ncbi:MAG: DUF4097 family beta strand repeat protein [Oscillospiraceae bacterium]|nr:DUF4097 family beta strand repeat protein [Oscillospiraceae bacterium]
MTSLQKAIKYLAMALAIFLSVTIIGGIFTALAGVSFIFSHKEENPAGDMKAYAVDGEISSLYLSLSSARFIVETGKDFSLESNHKYITVKSDNGKLRIDETKDDITSFSDVATIKLTIPKGFVFDDVTIETGAGEVKIDELSADILNFTFGAGEVEIKNLTANSRSKIDGGAGEVTIDGGLLRNLDIDMGVGELTLKSRLEGDSSIDYGVGETNLTLLGSREDYRIEIDKGLGEAKLEDENMNDDSVYGAGINHIDIDGGVGELNIEFSEYEVQNVA